MYNFLFIEKNCIKNAFKVQGNDYSELLTQWLLSLRETKMQKSSISCLENS